MGYWESKVLPKIKKALNKSGTKKAAAAAEAVKSFDASKDEYNMVFEEKKTELQPEVVKIYEATSVEIKSLVKEPNEAALTKNSTAVQKFLKEMVKIEFPGSKEVHEACSKYGPALVSGPVIFVFEKVSTFIVTEEKTEATPAAAAAEEEEETSGKERAIVAEEEKKEEVVSEKAESSEAAEEAKVEEKSTVGVPEAAKEEEKPVEPQPSKTE